MKKFLGWVKAKKKTVMGALAAFAFTFVLANSGPATTSASAAPVDFTGTTLPFTVPDMLTTATNFLTMYGQWVLLALGVLFAPILYSLAMKLVGSVRSKMKA
jgi:cytochrome oxidase Cu insertion factor (SCO1/SenC/PrrC family)